MEIEQEYKICTLCIALSLFKFILCTFPRENYFVERFIALKFPRTVASYNFVLKINHRTFNISCPINGHHKPTCVIIVFHWNPPVLSVFIQILTYIVPSYRIKELMTVNQVPLKNDA